MSQARKKSTKISFLGLETARWGGGLPREGVVAKKFVLSLESLSSLGLEERNLGCPGNFAGMSRTPGGVQKLRAKKVRAHFRSLMRAPTRAATKVAFPCFQPFIDKDSPQIRNFPVTPTPSTFSKVLPYKWEAYCRTNGSRAAVQIGGVLLGFPLFKA